MSVKPIGTSRYDFTPNNYATLQVGLPDGYESQSICDFVFEYKWIWNDYKEFQNDFLAL